MSNNDQERQERSRTSIEKMDEQYGEVFRRLAQEDPDEPEHATISDEELKATKERVIARYTETLKRLADS